MTVNKTNAPGAEDPFLWLEDIEGDAALDWVRAQNERSVARLEGDSRFEAVFKDARALYTATDRIPYGQYMGGKVHSFWQDESHVRGILRETSLDSYRGPDPDWETVLDIDALADEENENWVYHGRDFLMPELDRCLVHLSGGGGDAGVIREFDLLKRRFVTDGFNLPEGKQSASWLDRDTLLVLTGHGGGAYNTSGYPRRVRRWRRGTPVEEATPVYEAPEDDAHLHTYVSRRPEGRRAFIVRLPDFFHQQIFLVGNGGEAAALPLPDDVDFQGVFAGRLILLLRSDWNPEGTRFKSGSAVSIALDATVQAGAATGVRLIADPPAHGAIEGLYTTAGTVYVEMLDTVTGRLVAARPEGEGWTTEPVALPGGGSLDVVSTDDHSETAMVDFEGFLTPTTLYLAQDGAGPAPVKRLPQRIDPEPYAVEQHFAMSADGTEVPYFLLRAKDARFDGSTPTVLYGYGGFEVSLSPAYVSAVPKTWLEHGGAWVVANIRGGGEFGPSWHQAALKENRQRAYEDFIAVAESLIESGLTAPRRLGIYGGSNGGLLVGVALTQRPDLFNAVTCAVPLLDMLRFHKLLAGASWIGEYGDPDIPEERAVIAEYSPYQNVAEDAVYPEVFFTTSTNDDRVHPGHARKMTARMLDQGHDVLYYENTEGGHSAAANLEQMARSDARTVIYFLQRLADGDDVAPS